MYQRNLRTMYQKKDKPMREWKDDLVNWILYAKAVISIFEKEKDRWYNESDWKWKEQFDRNLLHYKERLKTLNEERNKQILLVLSKNENKETNI